MARHKNVNWSLPEPVRTWEQVNTAVLMDIRDELQTLNALLSCPNFMRIPFELRAIATNTKKRRYKTKARL